MSTAIIEVSALKLYAYHGVMPQERKVGNDYEVSVQLQYPCEHAMITDRLDSTIDYSEVVEVIKSEMAIPSALLENVVYRIYAELIRRFSRIHGGEIKLTKLRPPVEGQITAASFIYRW